MTISRGSGCAGGTRQGGEQTAMSTNPISLTQSLKRERFLPDLVNLKHITVKKPRDCRDEIRPAQGTQGTVPGQSDRSGSLTLLTGKL